MKSRIRLGKWNYPRRRHTVALYSTTGASQIHSSRSSRVSEINKLMRHGSAREHIYITPILPIAELLRCCSVVLCGLTNFLQEMFHASCVPSQCDPSTLPIHKKRNIQFSLVVLESVNRVVDSVRAVDEFSCAVAPAEI